LIYITKITNLKIKNLKLFVQCSIDHTSSDFQFEKLSQAHYSISCSEKLHHLKAFTTSRNTLYFLFQNQESNRFGRPTNNYCLLVANFDKQQMKEVLRLGSFESMEYIQELNVLLVIDKEMIYIIQNDVVERKIRLDQIIGAYYSVNLIMYSNDHIFIKMPEQILKISADFNTIEYVQKPEWCEFWDMLITPEDNMVHLFLHHQNQSQAHYLNVSKAKFDLYIVQNTLEKGMILSCEPESKGEDSRFQRDILDVKQLANDTYLYIYRRENYLLTRRLMASFFTLGQENNSSSKRLSLGIDLDQEDYYNMKAKDGMLFAEQLGFQAYVDFTNGSKLKYGDDSNRRWPKARKIVANN